MSVYVAKTPEEFRAKVLEMGATSLVYENGPFKSHVQLTRTTYQTIERVFNDCVCSVTSSSIRSNSTTRIFIPLIFEALKDGHVIITGKWSVVSMSV